MTFAEAAPDVAAGLALLAAGVVTWARARESRTGALLVVAGVAWLAGDVADGLVHAHRGPLVHVLLTFPSGRTRSRPITALVVLAYVDGLIPALARSPWPTVVLMAAVVGTAAWRWASAHGIERRERLIPFVCAAVIAAPLTLAAVGHLAGAETDVLASWMYQAAVVLTAGALAVDLLSGRSVRAAATGLIVDLADRQEPRALREALARTVGDPALEIAFRVDQEWVDEAGQPIGLPVSGETGERAVTLVEDGGTPVAALVHEPAALRDKALAQSIGAAVRLVMANVRLRAEDAARMREVAASRRRLVEAGDEQRRRLREQLRTGAEQTLTEVSRDMAAIAARREGEVAVGLVELVDELEAACLDLTRFAQGIHPKALTEHGLAEALSDLAGFAAVPVVVDAPTRRFPVPQEAAAYFVCSEALANVAKYAEASGVWIEVTESSGRLVVRVTDDGRGGADPARGSGLRGLADRVEALGGRLSIHSPVGVGTRLDAQLPIVAYAS